MNKEDVIITIKEVVKQVLDIDIVDENENLIDCHHDFPPVFLVYVLQKLSEKYGEEVYEIFKSDDYRVMCVSNLAEQIVKVCDKR